MKEMLKNRIINLLNDWLVYLIVLATLLSTTFYIQQDFQETYGQIFEVMSRIKLKISFLVG